MADRLEQIRAWFRRHGTGGAVTNAGDELDRRAAELQVLAALEARVVAPPVPVAAPEPAAA